MLLPLDLLLYFELYRLIFCKNKLNANLAFIINVKLKHV